MIKKYDHYDIHYEYGTIFAVPPMPAWMTQMMAETQEADVQSWKLLANAVIEEQIGNDQALHALVEIKARVQQTH